jgi:hypothetical protein
MYNMYRTGFKIRVAESSCYKRCFNTTVLCWLPSTVALFWLPLALESIKVIGTVSDKPKADSFELHEKSMKAVKTFSFANRLLIVSL